MKQRNFTGEGRPSTTRGTALWVWAYDSDDPLGALRYESATPEEVLRHPTVQRLINDYNDQVRRLHSWQAGAIGAATTAYPAGTGPHTEATYLRHRAAYDGGSDDYRDGADVVSAALLAAVGGPGREE